MRELTLLSARESRNISLGNAWNYRISHKSNDVARQSKVTPQPWKAIVVLTMSFLPGTSLAVRISIPLRVSADWLSLELLRNAIFHSKLRHFILGQFCVLRLLASHNTWGKISELYCGIYLRSGDAGRIRVVRKRLTRICVCGSVLGKWREGVTSSFLTTIDCRLSQRISQNDLDQTC